jgi:hypothetical protein
MSADLKIPYFDRRKSYDVQERFAKDPMQKLLALFLSNPENYAELASIEPIDQENALFGLFLRFADDYLTLTLDKHFDTMCYFRSHSVDRPGAVNVCGGGGKLSGSSKKYFKDLYKRGVENSKIMNAYLTDKYKLLPNARTFLGHTEIWKNPGPHLLELEGWQWVADQTYHDPTFKTPFPEKLDSALIPLEIRNKTIQKWQTARREKIPVLSAQLRREDEEEEEDLLKTPVQATIQPPAIIITAEMQALMDEDW